MTTNKLLTRFPVLLEQINAENNSSKLKNEIRQILYLLHQHNKNPKAMTEKSMVLIREPKTFYFDFDLSKEADKNLKYEI